MPTMFEDFRRALNTHSVDAELSTPDFILAEYLINCLNSYRQAKASTENWHSSPPQRIPTAIPVAPKEEESP